ncbi:ricin-type beta-trefoil lectin domain protein [Streptomyces caatingaensis]|uniref:ricin-type beta-trefoil lectin domain protein n=1 Tax=Streptomyces caatingaensis TaxID=1678637 RepID=UPI00069CC27F|nr:ricin-type beta-trefoil lectin domain protein [Streptomyces caatingaensis]
MVLLALAVLAALVVRPDALDRLTDARPAGDSYDGFDASAAEQLRQDQCLMATVLRTGGPTMFAHAQDALNQSPDKLHLAADRQYWEHTPLAKAFDKDKEIAAKEGAVDDRLQAWKIPLAGLSTPDGFSESGFHVPPGLPIGDDFFDQTGLSRWLGQQFWKDEGDFYKDPTPRADDVTVKAVKDVGTPLYGKDPDPGLPNPQWQQAFAERQAWERLVNWSMDPTGADDARIFLTAGGFPRTVPEPGSLEFRLAVEDLKSRFATCAWRTPPDPSAVLGKEVAAASQEWQQEIASQALQRNQILSANHAATRALAAGAKSLGEMLGQSWIADHLAIWQDYWSPGGPGWIGDSPVIVHAHGAPDKCLDVQGGKKANGTAVQLYTCNGTGAQKWVIDGDALRNLDSGKCLDVKGSGTANGTAVQLWTCNGTKAQNWRYSTHGTTSLRSIGTGNCLDMHTFSNGRDAWVWDCNGTAAQKFDIVPSGHNGADNVLRYPQQGEFDQAKKGVMATQAEAVKQLGLIKAQVAVAKKAAAAVDTAEQAAYTIADKAGAPRGRGLLVGRQKAQVTKAAAAALEAMAKAGETAYAATRAAAGDSATVAARALTQAAASKAAFRTAAAQEANAQAKAAANAAAVQAKAAKDARDTARAKLAETEKAEADAKAAAATAHAKRLAAEKEEATAKAEKEIAAQKQAEAAEHRKSAEGYATTAENAKGRAEAAESTAAEKRKAAEEARDKAQAKRSDAWDAAQKADAARAKADAKDAYAQAHESDDNAKDARAAANEADKAANEAEVAAKSARAEADAATQAAADADAAATRAEAAAKRARSDADAAKSAKLRADAAVKTATSTAADAIRASQDSAMAARTAVKLADDAEKEAVQARKHADAAKAEAAKAVAGSAEAAGHAHTTAQAAEDARSAAQQVAAPANDAIQLGSPYMATDYAAGLAVLTGQSSKAIAEQQLAVAEAHAENAKKAAEQARSVANAAKGDAKAAYVLASDAAGHAADARKSAKEALGYAAEAAKAAADAAKSLARTIEHDRQATADADAADRAATNAEGHAKDARSSADQAALDAEGARKAAAEAEEAAKSARAAADRADAQATAAEAAAKDAHKAAEDAQKAAEEAVRKQANKQVSTGAGTGIERTFYVVDKVTPNGDPESTTCVLGMGNSGCDVTYTLRFDAVISFYLCINPDVPATEAGCPKSDTVFLGTQTQRGLTKKMTKHFSNWDIVKEVDKAFLKGIWGALTQDFVDCWHGSASGCAWAAVAFVPGEKIAAAVKALIKLDEALKTGVGVAGAWKAAKAAGLKGDVLAGVGKRVNDARRTSAGCKIVRAATIRRVAMAGNPLECMPPLLDDESEAYVVAKHVVGGKNVTHEKGVFDADIDLDELVEMSLASHPVGPNKSGFFERDVDARRLIGLTSEMTGRQPTSWFKLVQDKYGGVRTMYPITKPTT